MRSVSVSALRAFLAPPSTAGGWLGYSGLMPFIGLSVASVLLDSALQILVLFTLQAYAATILSFLGAIHWGLALRDPLTPSTGLLVWGVVPSLLAWVALLLDAISGLWLLAAGLWLCLAVDWRVYPRFGLRSWLGLRIALTSIATLACIFAASGAAR